MDARYAHDKDVFWSLVVMNIVFVVLAFFSL